MPTVQYSAANCGFTAGLMSALGSWVRGSLEHTYLRLDLEGSRRGRLFSDMFHNLESFIHLGNVADLSAIILSALGTPVFRSVNYLTYSKGVCILCFHQSVPIILWH